MAAQHGRRILTGDEASPHQATVAEHQGEQPDDPLPSRLVGEDGPEMGEVDLRLFARRGLEAALEGRCRLGPDGAQEILQDRVAAAVAKRLDIPEQASAAEVREGLKALPQVGLIGADQGRPGRPRRVDRRLQPLGDILADRLAIEAGPARDG
jgi:hypothetical protein